MDNTEVKLYVAELLNQGVSLSDIQKKLQTEKNVKMTFFDLRLLASELKAVDWSKQKADIEAQKAKEKAEAEKIKEGNKSDKETTNKTVVELSRLARPGAVANGSVRFGSGAKADWVIDQHGRLALEKAEGEPTKEDIREFQKELQKILSGA